MVVDDPEVDVGKVGEVIDSETASGGSDQFQQSLARFVAPQNALEVAFRFRLAVFSATVVVLTAAITLAVLRQGVRWAILHEMGVDSATIETMIEEGRALSP